MTQTQLSSLGVLVTLAESLVLQTFALTNQLPVTALFLGTNPFIVRTLSLDCLVVSTLVVTELLMFSISINILGWFRFTWICQDQSSECKSNAQAYNEFCFHFVFFDMDYDCAVGNEFK